jgi:eukaryotic-like serine/threonine-protein kinase
MALPPGSRLDNYEILGLLGAGGMGEVYHARDSALRREVAIKILPAFVSQDPERIHLFELEARAAAALNHPNILAVYQLGSFQGSLYLVTELLEGETLRSQLERAPVITRKALEYAIHIARGLSAAHEKGIVHRDLKPENLFVTKDGRIKILDFGLAKLIQPPTASKGDMPTLTHQTAPGLVMGTVGYMSPEQVRGIGVDHRTDIFAFGAVLYEMLCGVRAFHRGTDVETMTAILNEDPPTISQVLPMAPPGLQRVVRRCLEKNPEQRFQSASDLAFAIEALSESNVTPVQLAAPELHPPRKWMRVLLVPATIFAVAALAFYLVVKRSPAMPHISGYTQITHSGNAGEVYGTDGVRLYLSQNRYGITEVAVAGGDISLVKIDLPNPFLADVSPDGSRFLVFSLNSGTGPSQPFWSLNILGGAHQYLAAGIDASWSPDGSLVAYTTPDGNLLLIKSDGTEAHKVASIGGRGSSLSWSPDGKAIRFSRSGALWEVSSSGANLHPLLPGWKGYVCCGGHSSPDGRFFYFNSDGQIFAREEHRSLFGKQTTPVQLTTGPIEWGNPIPGKDGTRIFVQGSIQRGELVRFDLQTKQFQPYLGGFSADNVAFSKDSESIAFVSYPDCILWSAKRDGSDRVQLSSPPTCPVQPTWSPDGSQILFVDSSAEDGPKAFLVPSHGGRSQRLIPDDKGLETDSNWSADGTKIVFSNSRFGGKDPNSVLKIFDLMSGQLSILAGSTGMFAPRWSPNGRSIAAIPMDSIGLNVFDVKTQRWSMPYKGLTGYQSWSADSKSIYFLNFLENPAVLRIRVEDGAIERAVDLKDFRYTGNGGGWMGLDPTGAPLFLRDISTSDIYSLNVERK